jgi:Holliday junction resolvase
MTEQQIQKKITDQLTKEGWYVIKLIKTTTNGIPDLMALRNGFTRFIEVKTPKGVLSEIQKFRIKQLQRMDFQVDVWVDYEVDYIK